MKDVTSHLSIIIVGRARDAHMKSRQRRLVFSSLNLAASIAAIFYFVEALGWGVAANRIMRDECNGILSVDASV